MTKLDETSQNTEASKCISDNAGKRLILLAAIRFVLVRAPSRDALHLDV